MKPFTIFLFFSGLLFNAIIGYSQSSQTVELHFQLHNEGICLPMQKSIYYNTSRYRPIKSALQSGVYYSTIYAFVHSLDSGDLSPQTNHKLQSSSLQLNPKLDYELVFLRYNGFNKLNPDSMIIHITKLDQNAQLVLPFKKGNFMLQEMNYFQKLDSNTTPTFSYKGSSPFKFTLKLDSIARYPNGKTKVKYYKIADNFPLHYVQEFDSLNPTTYAQGFRLLMHPPGLENNVKQAVWANAENTKYGYWEYIENGKRLKHEMWASMLQARFEWYPIGRL